MTLPTVQRFVIMSWDLPGPVATGSEILVMAARLGLVIYVISKVGPAPHAWASTKNFLRERWPVHDDLDDFDRAHVRPI